MKSLRKIISLILPLIALFGVCAFQAQQPVAQADVTSTPTYDPLVETPLPANPTELELGANLYWHWCMPCHGDVGQGLTDEFRGIWEPDHQNCWGRGCHAGHEGDMGFPIPTVVPAIVVEDELAQFSSLQTLADYLKATHPPQRPGILENKEYHAIAAYVFTLNQRTLIESTSTAIPSPSSTASLIPPKEEAISSPGPNSGLIASGILLLLAILIIVLVRKSKP
jgi:cytochrome c